VKLSAALFAVWSCLSLNLSLAQVAIAPANSSLQYTGRIDFTHRDAPVITWPHSSISANFTGPSLAVVLDDQYGKNYFNVFIDGAQHPHTIIEARQGQHEYVISNRLSDKKHNVLITKRTEGEQGATVFKGLTLADRGKLQRPAMRPKRRIEFFGDSITSGMGNEAAIDAADDVLKEQNSYMSYASITARNLSAEMHMTSQSGIGIMVSWFNFTMPQFYDQLSAVGDNDTHWDFDSWTPDVVVINLFQNDSWLVEKRLDPIPTDEQRIQAYVDFVASIRSKYPKAYIVCTLGSMDATQHGSKWPGYIESAISRLKPNDKKIDSLFFEFAGYGKHPRVQHHQVNAEKLTRFIQHKMHW
jgi:hypothetical protein